MPGSPPPLRPRDALLSALQIGVAYLVVGGLWIWLSDAAVVALSDDPAWREAAQRYKGLVYIVLTTAGLVYLVHRSHQHLIAANAAVARTELRVADLFERHPQPMWVQDATTCRFLRVNEAAVRAYGYSREEFLCLATRDIWPEADVPSFPGEFDSPTLGALARGVSRHRRKDGRAVLARLTEHHLELDGRPALMVMAEDVTREALIVEALQRQQQQRQQLEQQLVVVLWTAASDGTSLSDVSPSLLELTGWHPARLKRDPGAWHRLIHPEDRHRVPPLLAPLVAAEPRWVYRIVRPDGEVRWVEDRRCQMRDAAGEPGQVGGMVQDITGQPDRTQA